MEVTLTEVGEFGDGEEGESEGVEHLSHQVTHPLLPPLTPHGELLGGRGLTRACEDSGCWEKSIKIRSSIRFALTVENLSIQEHKVHLFGGY